MDDGAFQRAELALLLARVRDETTAWLCGRIGGSAGQCYERHFSQLRALERWFLALHEGLLQRLAAARDRDADGLRRVRRAALGLLGVWTPLRARLEQRELADLAVWRCADAVSDSCYAPTLAALRRLCGEERVPARPYPLPFLSPVVAPYMLPAGYLPREFTQALGTGAQAFAQRWPLPMVHLPIACKWDPWWIVMLGHEVGHQVEFDLGIGEPLAAALAGAGGEPHWAGWAHEIFADAYAVLTLGRAATRALYELVQDGSSLCQRYPDYPPALVRLALMEMLADGHGLLNDGAGLPEEFAPTRLAAGDPACLRDLAALPAIVGVLQAPLPGWPCTLAELCEPDPADAAVLRPRQVIAQQFAGWVGLRGGSLADLPARRESLRAETVTRLEAAAPGGKREFRSFGGALESGADPTVDTDADVRDDADVVLSVLSAAAWRLQ